MGDDRDDAALVLAARDGDRDAVAALLIRHESLLRALCRRMLGDPDAVEDAIQEAALQAMLSLDRLRRPEQFGPWLAGIGLNVCRRMLRERSHMPLSWDALCGGRFLPEPADPQRGPEAVAEAADLANRVRQAVAGLPSGQRSAVVLFYLSGLTLAETAETLGIEVGALKTRLHKARRTLRRHLVDDRIDRTPRANEEEALMSNHTAAARYIEMRPVDVRRSTKELPARHVVILDEVGGDRRLPIWVGGFEGMAIALHIEGVETARPMTFVFAARLLAASGARLREVRVDRLAESVFYAVTVIEGPEGERQIDARPSDAINLALLTGAPIRVNVSVLEAIAAQADAWRDIDRQETVGAAAIVAEMMASWPGFPPAAPPAS